MANRSHDKGANCVYVGNMSKCLVVGMTMLMMKATSNKTSLVALQRTITTSLNLVDPLTIGGSVWAGKKGHGWGGGSEAHESGFPTGLMERTGCRVNLIRARQATIVNLGNANVARNMGMQRRQWDEDGGERRSRGTRLEKTGKKILGERRVAASGVKIKSLKLTSGTMRGNMQLLFPRGHRLWPNKATELSDDIVVTHM